MRQAIWDFVRQLDGDSAGRSDNQPGLIELSREIAMLPEGPVSPYAKFCPLCPNQTCPQPLNYLVNGLPPEEAPLGLAGLMEAGASINGARDAQGAAHKKARLFLGCNFTVLTPLAGAKGAPSANATSAQLCGFAAVRAAGLAVLFGPATDFCLRAWATQPVEYQKARDSTLLLVHSGGPLANHTVQAGVDWGRAQLENFFFANDAPRQKLIRAMLSAAQPARRTSLQPPSFEEQQDLERFIARRRIFIFPIFPWFACGKGPLPESVPQKNALAGLPQLKHWLRILIHRLRPDRVATLGSWAFAGADYGANGLASDVEHNRPSRFTREFLAETPFANCPAREDKVRHFLGPEEAWEARPKKGVSLPWFEHCPEYRGRREPPTNAEAVAEFLRREPG